MQLKFKDVSYEYQKNQEILQQITLDLQHGLTVLCGNNGSGKSTLINLLNFIYKPKQGTRYLNQQKYEKKNKNKEHQKIATVYQFSDNELFNLTVEEDLLYAIKVQKKNLAKAQVKIEDYFKIFKLDISILKTSPFKLSGGQKKKISIISALILEPEILILDEPLIGLDNKAKKEILQILMNLKKELKIIVVLHNYNNIFTIADHIMELANKRIALHVPVEKFFQKKYENNKIQQLTDSLKICKLLNLEYEQAKKLNNENIVNYLRENYALY
ncbi:MAG: energy-coupling factor ABC transporter ATP-binding protein [Mycoplasmatales bacterium]